MSDFNINDVLEVVAWILVWAFIISTLAVMYLTKPEGKESMTILTASKIKVGDRIITPMGEAIVRKSKTTKIKIPARVEESIIFQVNLANGEGREWTVGTTNVQLWGTDKVTKVVEPGFFKKFMAFIRSL